MTMKKLKNQDPAFATK